MIQSITLKNFQSHKDTALELHSGVNVFVGESAAGKSAIIRALRLLCYNEPNGDSYRSWWGGDTEVTIEDDASNVITRGRTSSKNFYKLNDDIMTGFGTDVPEQIKTLLAMQSLNLQKQKDGAFLLSSNTGDVAKFFNKIAGLDIIDKSTHNVNTLIRGNNDQLNHVSLSIKENLVRLEAYANIKEMGLRVEALEQKEIDLNTLKKDIDTLEEIQRDIQLLHIKKKRLNKLVKLGGMVEAILKKSTSFKSKREELKELNDLRYDLSEVKDILKKHSKIIKLKGQCVSILDKFKTYKETRQISKEMSEEYISIKNKKELKERILTKVIELRKELPDTCPLCKGSGKLK